MKDTASPPRLHVFLSTGCYAGLIPWAPGTMGALGALALWYVGWWLLPSVEVLTWVTAACVVVGTVVGVWTSGVMERYWGEDPRAVVIDEYVGTWIPLLVAPCGGHTWWLALLALALFRLFDIWKPLGCRWIDNHVKGGLGIMLDDILAGVYALIVLAAVRWMVA